MADQLYLSLWFPDFRFDSLPTALVKVLRQFPAVGASARVSAATVFPISWNEAPVYQRIYSADEGEDSIPELAVAQATEFLHDDYAYEFEMKWDLWTPELQGELDPIWKKKPQAVRVVGFGPEFDEGFFEQNGHIRVDFGLESPFLQEEVELDTDAAEHVKENVQLLVDFTNAVQANTGISSRLLWSESGESLAEKLISRLQRLN
jgi:hypothetical protein